VWRSERRKADATFVAVPFRKSLLLDDPPEQNVYRDGPVGMLLQWPPAHPVTIPIAF
jgi:hypothetical protein